MSSTMRVRSRKIFQEDLELTTDYTPTPSSQTVMGVGTVSLTPINAVLFSSFGAYANDSVAAAHGIPIGGVYYNTTNSNLHARQS